MSASGIALIAPVVAKEGDHVIVNIDEIGELEGLVVRYIPNGFALTIMATGRKRGWLVPHLVWLARRFAMPSGMMTKSDPSCGRRPST
jgi:hypothetical protein